MFELRGVPSPWIDFLPPRPREVAICHAVNEEDRELVIATSLVLFLLGFLLKHRSEFLHRFLLSLLFGGCRDICGGGRVAKLIFRIAINLTSFHIVSLHLEISLAFFPNSILQLINFIHDTTQPQQQPRR